MKKKKLLFNSQGVDVKFFTYARDSGAKCLLEADWSFHNITHADWLIQMINWPIPAILIGEACTMHAVKFEAPAERKKSNLRRKSKKSFQKGFRERARAIKQRDDKDAERDVSIAPIFKADPTSWLWILLNSLFSAKPILSTQIFFYPDFFTYFSSFMPIFLFGLSFD